MPLTTLPYTIHASLHLQVKEAKKYYPLFGMFANVALVFSGQFVRYVSQMKARLPMGVDPWGVALNYLMSAVCLSGAVTMGCYRYLAKNVVQNPDAAPSGDDKLAPKKKKKPSMSMGDSFKYLAGSRCGHRAHPWACSPAHPTRPHARAS